MTVSEKFKKTATHLLTVLAAEAKGVIAVVVATIDGFDVATYADSETDVQKIAAMASSMGAIGAVVGEESKVGSCKSIMIEAEQGFVVMVEIKHPQHALILTVVAQNSSVLGQLVYRARETAKEISQLDV
jgi:uncharacterized protein